MDVLKGFFHILKWESPVFEMFGGYQYNGNFFHQDKKYIMKKTCDNFELQYVGLEVENIRHRADQRIY